MNTIPARQVWLFQFGCWVAFAVAALHVAIFLTGRVDLPPHAQLGLALMPVRPYAIAVPGTAPPAFMGIVSALSLTFALTFVTIGAAGLAIVRRYDFTPRLLRAVAGAFALGTGLMLIVSITLAFSLQTFVLALVPICFGLTCVPEE